MENSLILQDQDDGQPVEKPYEEGKTLDQLISMVEEAEEASNDSRKLSETCRKYHHNKQLSSEEKKALKARGQPEVMENIIRRKIKFLKGWERQTRSDPKAFPRNSPDDEDASEAATDALRFQEQAQFLDQTFSQVWEDMILCGYGGVEVLGPNLVDPRQMDVKLWRWDRLGHDPHSSANDFSDARYLYTVTWMDKEEAVDLWPKAKDGINKTCQDEVTTSTRTYADKPSWKTWATRKERERVKVIQISYRKGLPGMPNYSWHWCIFTKGAKLDSGAVELMDQFDQPECPLILHSAYVDEENNRYGEVVEMLTMQDAVNKTHSKLVHLMNSQRTISEQGAILDLDKFKAEMAKPDGAAEVAPGALTDKRFQIVENTADAMAHMQRLQDTRARFDMMGPNAALQGKQGNSASGRAIRASQEGGLIELTDVKDEHTHLKRRVYRSLWNRIRQFWNEETWVRVTDNDENLKFVGFNRPVTMFEDLMKQAEKEGIPPEEAQAKIEERAQQDQMFAAQLEQVVSTENVPAEIDVDIIVDVATESVNMQEETFQTISNLFPPGSLPMEVVLELAPISPKKKRQIKEMMKPKPGDLEKQAMADGLKAENLSADTEQKKAKATKDRADAGAKTVEAAAMQMPVAPMDQAFLT